MNVTVVGSIMVDLVAHCGRYPARGETMAGESFAIVPGGKGANPAVACMRMGCAVTLVGSVGKDPFAEIALAFLAQSGVDTDRVYRTNSSRTGTAFIVIDASAENTILLMRGANDDLPVDVLERSSDRIAGADALLVQLEISLPVVERAMAIARRAGVPILLDPAPAQPIPDHFLALADFVTPNEQETKTLTGIDPLTPEAAAAAADALHRRGARQVIIKRGSKGCLVSAGGQRQNIEGIPVRPIDTVGAGDCFAGALISAWLETRDIFQACRFANVAAALKVQRSGAQSGVPLRKEVDEWLKTLPEN